jgi:hypothetical protein
VPAEQERVGVVFADRTDDPGRHVAGVPDLRLDGHVGVRGPSLCVGQHASLLAVLVDELVPLRQRDLWRDLDDVQGEDLQGAPAGDVDGGVQ